MTALVPACEAYLAAERKYQALKSYTANLPADESYDLGVRVDIAWDSSTLGGQEMQAAVRKLVAADIRTHILHAVAQAGDARDKALERLRADAEHSRA